MSYPLQDLLRVRILREDRAMEAILSAQRKVEESHRYLEDQKEALANFHQFRLTEEVRLYDTIIGKIVEQDFVDETMAQINELRHQEKLHEKRVEEAKENLKKAQDNLIQAKKNYQNAVKSRQKIEEHRVIWLEAFQKEQDFYAEKELEDLKGKRV